MARRRHVEKPKPNEPGDIGQRDHEGDTTDSQSQEQRMPEDNKPTSGSFVDRLVTDPKNPPDVTLLQGWFGASSEEGSRRLYLDPELTQSLEIPEDAILGVQDIPPEQSALGGSYVWIKSDAQTKQGPGMEKLWARFLQGQIQQDFLSGGMGGMGAGAGGGLGAGVGAGQLGFTNPIICQVQRSLLPALCRTRVCTLTPFGCGPFGGGAGGVAAGGVGAAAGVANVNIAPTLSLGCTQPHVCLRSVFQFCVSQPIWTCLRPTHPIICGLQQVPNIPVPIPDPGPLQGGFNVAPGAFGAGAGVMGGGGMGVDPTGGVGGGPVITAPFSIPAFLCPPTQAPNLCPSQHIGCPTFAPFLCIPTRVPALCPTHFPVHCPTHFPAHCPTQLPAHCPTQLPAHCPTQLPHICPSHFIIQCPSNPIICNRTIPIQCQVSLAAICPGPDPTGGLVDPTGGLQGGAGLGAGAGMGFDPTGGGFVGAAAPPVTILPACNPTVFPAACPSQHLGCPTFAPFLCLPTRVPTLCPTHFPAQCPTQIPANCPTHFPAFCPSLFPQTCPSHLIIQCPTNPIICHQTFPIHCQVSLVAICPGVDPTGGVLDPTAGLQGGAGLGMGVDPTGGFVGAGVPSSTTRWPVLCTRVPALCRHHFF